MQFFIEFFTIINIKTFLVKGSMYSKETNWIPKFMLQLLRVAPKYASNPPTHDTTTMLKCSMLALYVRFASVAPLGDNRDKETTIMKKKW
jgi:hypothetical protein